MKIFNQLILFDLDRTIFDTEKFGQEFVKIGYQNPNIEGDFWLNNSKKVIEKLIDLDIPIGILTYGDLKFQQLKLNSLNYEIDFIITQDIDKGRLIENWKKGDCYQVNFDNDQQVLAKKIILVDDKISNLVNIPNDCSGICFDEMGKKDFPTKIDNLEQIFDYV